MCSHSRPCPTSTLNLYNSSTRQFYNAFHFTTGDSERLNSLLQGPRFKPRQWGSTSCVLGPDIVCIVRITDKQSQAVNHVSQGCKSLELYLATKNTECLLNGKGWVYSVLCLLNI